MVFVVAPELPTPSLEQSIIVDAINYNNVKVDAVAGSGKTTTILHIANKYKARRVLVITFNSKLRHETKKRAELFSLNNLKVHTYHSFGVSFYSPDCKTDTGLIHAVGLDSHEFIKELNYDIIIIDEIQDMNSLYYRFITKLILANINPSYKICVMGDQNQCIYQFKSADEKYIVHADTLFDFNEHNNTPGSGRTEFVECKLSVSYRLGKSIATFVNKCVLKTDRIQSVLTFPSNTDYVICNAFDAAFIYNEYLKPLLRKCKPSDIFILAASVGGSNSPIAKLANLLSNRGIDMYVTNNGETKLDERVLKNKLVISSFHQVKGLERKIVLVYGFDQSYYEYYDKRADKTKCPNVFYVALTRSITRLILIHGHTKNYMPFIDKHKLAKYARFRMRENIYILPAEMRYKPDYVVTDLIKFIPSEVIHQASQYFISTEVQPIGKVINIDTVSEQDDLYEQVSDITGIAIPAYFEYISNKNLTILDIVKSDGVDIKIRDFVKDIDISQSLSTIRLLKIANAYRAHIDKYHYRLNQIKYNSWLSDGKLKKCMNRMANQISKNYEVEAFVFSSDILSYVVKGRIDFIDKDTNTVWEIKCVHELAPEHFIQLACYAYLYETDVDMTAAQKAIARKYKLFNVLTNQIYEITFNLADLKKMIELLVSTKLSL